MQKFSPRHGKIMQVAYIVPDLEVAVQAFAVQLNIGGWVIVEKLAAPRMIYREKPSNLTLAVGLAYQGDMMFEFIQPLSDMPSVYKETNDKSGYGFHHFGILVESLEKEISTYRQRGFDLVCEVTTSAGGQVGYMDTRGSLPGMLELIEDSAPVREFFQMVWQHQRVLKGRPDIVRV